MALVYLGLGSNLGNRKDYILSAIQALEKILGKHVKCSSLYETAPWGFSSEHLFINAAVSYHTDLSPKEILDITKGIETTLGRTEKSHNNHYTDRVIDIDILLYDQMVIQEENLVIPHPRMHERMFVLEPLSEIDPNIIHPILHHSIEELKDSLSNSL